MRRFILDTGIMIAAIALSLVSATVVTMDSDLASIPGLTVENWPDGE
jgi:predicted nucleic acid-binding protein